MLVLGLAAAWLAPSSAESREQASADGAGVVVTTRAVQGFPWPEVVVVARLPAPPVDVMAVYTDFDRHARFLPDMVQSRVIRRIAAPTFHVFYEYEVTGPNERYTVEVRVDRVPGGYRARWDLITARYARRLAGEVQVVAEGAQAEITYRSRVDPGPLGVRLGSPESVARSLSATVIALRREVLRLRADAPQALAALVRRLEGMVEGGGAG